MSNQKDPQYCQTCKQALSPLERDGVIYFRHREELRGASTDHPAAPVPLSQLPDAALICDFCDRPDAAYIYTCAPDVSDLRRVTATYVSHSDFLRRSRAARVIRQDTEVELTQHWGEKWSACPACSTLIETGSLEQLISRVTDVLPAKMTRSNKIAETRAMLRGRYTHVLATLQAGRETITPGRPAGDPEPLLAQVPGSTVRRIAVVVDAEGHSPAGLPHYTCPQCGGDGELATFEQLDTLMPVRAVTLAGDGTPTIHLGEEQTVIDWDFSRTTGVKCGAAGCGFSYLGADWPAALAAPRPAGAPHAETSGTAAQGQAPSTQPRKPIADKEMPGGPEQQPATSAIHDCVTEQTLVYRGEYGAPGFGQSWQCATCERSWARLGSEFYPAELGTHILRPEDTE